jgi:hypothetical protein
MKLNNLNIISILQIVTIVDQYYDKYDLEMLDTESSWCWCWQGPQWYLQTNWITTGFLLFLLFIYISFKFSAWVCIFEKYKFQNFKKQHLEHTGWILQIFAIFKITYYSLIIILTDNLKTVLELWGKGLQKTTSNNMT